VGSMRAAPFFRRAGNLRPSAALAPSPPRLTRISCQASLGPSSTAEPGHGAVLRGAVCPTMKSSEKPACDAASFSRHQAWALARPLWKWGRPVGSTGLCGLTHFCTAQLSVEHDLVHRPPRVESTFESAPHAGVLGPAGFRPWGQLATFDQKAKKPQRTALLILAWEIASPHVLDVGRQHALHHVQPARPNFATPHGAVDDRQVVSCR